MNALRRIATIASASLAIVLSPAIFLADLVVLAAIGLKEFVRELPEEFIDFNQTMARAIKMAWKH